MLKQIEFEEISLDDVPSRPPSTKPSSNQRVSQWDNALRVIERGRGRRGAIKIHEPSHRRRNWMKSTLQTMARKRDCFVEVRGDDETAAVYAWASEKGGRFSRPGE